MKSKEKRAHAVIQTTSGHWSEHRRKRGCSKNEKNTKSEQNRSEQKETKIMGPSINGPSKKKHVRSSRNFFLTDDLRALKGLNPQNFQFRI